MERLKEHTMTRSMNRFAAASVAAAGAVLLAMAAGHAQTQIKCDPDNGGLKLPRRFLRRRGRRRQPDRATPGGRRQRRRIRVAPGWRTTRRDARQRRRRGAARQGRRRTPRDQGGVRHRQRHRHRAPERLSVPGEIQFGRALQDDARPAEAGERHSRSRRQRACPACRSTATRGSRSTARAGCT